MNDMKEKIESLKKEKIKNNIVLSDMRIDAENRKT